MRSRHLLALVIGVALAVPAAALVPTSAQPAPAPAIAPVAPSASLAPTPDRMPGDVPSKKTPWVLDGEVTKIVQVGNTMIAGGLFTQVADPMNGTQYARQNLFAFDATTGLVSQTFNPTVNGQVQQLMPGPTPNTVYVAGEFTKINSKGPNHIQLLDVTTGLAVTSFKAPSTNGAIQTMDLLPGNRLFIGGSFTKMAGVARGQLATLNATTGAFDPFMDITVSGRHNNTGSGAKSPVGARESGVTPAGDRLVVVGNFRVAGGLGRNQIVVLDLTGPSAAVSTGWNTTRYIPLCAKGAFDGYMRDVEMSPDGSFFVVSTTGGPFSGTLCDTAARFETYAVGTTLEPTWISHSGGDTLVGVEITESAVYVGGHQRWMNNPSGSDRAQQGAVPRPGLVALDPESGVPLKWNPGRNPRGVAAYEVYETEAGIWVVSDTPWIGDRRYQRPRIAFFPYAEGYNTASKSTGSLPGNVYVGAPSTISNAAKVIDFNGSSVTSQSNVSTGTFDWTNVRNAVMVGRTLFYGQTDGMLYKRSFDGVSFGEPTAVNPYLDPLWSTVLTGSGPAGQTYAGVLPTWYGQLSSVTGMFYAGGRIYYTRSGQNSLYWRWFSPDSGIIGGVESTVAGGNISWSSTRGMFLDGSNLYVVSSTSGQLLRIGFVGGAPTGTSTVANTTIDWRGRAVFLASVLPNVAPTASFTSACTGITCSFDANGSADSDGTVQSYEWTFSDGDEAGGPTPEKDFAETGTYDVTLTVTDDGGLSSSVTHQVTVVKPNVPPTAAFITSCEHLDCDFDATASTDSDGTVDDYSWDFGDGETGTGSNPSHVYDEPGSYDITLVVTDNEDATDEVTSTQVVLGAPAASTVSYVGGAVNQGNVSTPNVTTPATVSAGDRLVLALSVNASNRVISDPTGITGWTVLATTTSGSMQTRLYTKNAVAADANRRVTVPLDAAVKYTMSVAAYSGVRPGSLVHAELAETVNQTGHTTPVVDAPAGSWVVSYWADKSSATTAFTLPATVTGRTAQCNTGSGRVCSTLADSDGAVPTGLYGGLVATADAASGSATTASVVLRTVEPNLAPSAAFTFECAGTDCDFDGSGSSDPDGSVLSYAWDFGDGGTAAGPTPSHDFVTSGSRDVTLTVTDDEGTPGSVVIPVAVVRINAVPTASFTTSCSFLVCTFDAGGSGDPDGSVASYTWDFGDGQTDTTTGANPSHAYQSAGSYVVTLTVTDNDGGEGNTTRDVSPVAVRPIAHVGSNVNQGNVTTPNTIVPAATAAGDRLLLVLSLNDASRTPGTPASGVTGWTLVDNATSGTMQTFVYTKVAVAGDGGRTVRFAMDSAAKYTLTVAAYRGDMLSPLVAPASETVLRAGHTTPTLDAETGDWAVSYWADKSSTTTGFTLPGGVSQREATCGINAGRICSVLADSGGAVSAGPYGGLVATADGASANATMWTILLRQDG